MAANSGRILAVVALLVGSLVGAGVTLSAVGPAAPGDADPIGSYSPPADAELADAGVDTFESREAFESYLRQGRLLDGGYHVREVTLTADVGGNAVAMEASREAPVPQAASGDAGADGGDGGGAAPSRIANTNVQVAGLDEPDVVKTDGRHFYYAPEGRDYRVRPEPLPGPREGDAAPPERADRDTHVVDASDPDAPAAVAHIDTSGKLLQTGDTLVVIESEGVAGYDVSDPAEPVEEWRRPLNGSLVTAREHNGTLYLVTESRVDYGTPCPVEPLGPDSAVACTDVYRPGTQIPVDATYSAFSVDAADGEVGDAVSFVGTAENTVVYMASDALYVTYTKRADRAALLGEFVREEFDLTPASVDQRVAEIQSYDISAASKEREIRRAIEQWTASLAPGEREAARVAFRDGFASYLAGSQRALTRTGIVRVGVDGGDLAVETTGTVPGRPLDQFSLDQHEGSLRITTTIPAVGDAPSRNDLYTLDAGTLQRQGAVTGMGETERVYSVRYVGETAYVVTFRRIDPFHVVDLSDPADPRLEGELKLPGFSSYLHPVDDDHVLGVGEEDGRVKTVLFDVSNPANPTVADDEILAQRWSAVSETHHAFLMDRKHGVFFLPAGQQGVVMDYTNGSLSVETRIDTDAPPSRARYVEDSLYVFAGERVAVVNETTWERTTTLDLRG